MEDKSTPSSPPKETLKGREENYWGETDSKSPSVEL